MSEGKYEISSTMIGDWRHRSWGGVSGRERQHTSRTTTGNSRVVGDTGDIYYPHPDRRSRKVCPDTTPCVRQPVASTQRTKHETMRPPPRVLAQNLGPVELPKVVIVSCEANTRVCETTGATGAMATGFKMVSGGLGMIQALKHAKPPTWSGEKHTFAAFWYDMTAYLTLMELWGTVCRRAREQHQCGDAHSDSVAIVHA